MSNFPDVTGRTCCRAGQEVLPDGEDQTFGIQAPAAGKPAPIHIREEEGHCSSCQKRPGKGDLYIVLPYPDDHWLLVSASVFRVNLEQSCLRLWG